MKIEFREKLRNIIYMNYPVAVNLSAYPNCTVAINGEDYKFDDDPETMVKVLLSNMH